jgi:uncharacterized membrane protein
MPFARSPAMSTLYSKVKVGGHPLHPMLIAFPVTFYTTTLFGFTVYALTGHLFWWRVGLWSNVAGVITAALAAVPGFIDWAVGIPRGTEAKRTGQKHMLLNLAALASFAANLYVQRHRWPADVLESGLAPSPQGAVVLSLLGFLLTVGAGYLGFSLVQTHHVGVDLTPDQERYEPGAHDATPPRPITQA